MTAAAIARACELPRLIDIPFSIMALFGQKPPSYMQGRMIFAQPAETAGVPAQTAEVRGTLDPATLNQSGAAPGARVLPVESQVGAAHAAS